MKENFKKENYRKAHILFERTEEGMMKFEVDGRLQDLLNILLIGIEHMFDDPVERALFKSGLKQVFEHWNEEEAKGDD